MYIIEEMENNFIGLVYFLKGDHSSDPCDLYAYQDKEIPSYISKRCDHTISTYLCTYALLNTVGYNIIQSTAYIEMYKTTLTST